MPEFLKKFISKNEQSRNSENKSKLRAFFDYIIDVLIDAVIIILIVVVIRSFVVSPFQVSGKSMVDTFQNNDYIFIEKISYSLDVPEYLDIIVFEPPIPRYTQHTGFRCLIEHVNNFSLKSDVCNRPDYFIKRVIGVPGDIIEFKDGQVIRNGDIINESAYLNKTNNGNTLLPDYQKQTVFEVPSGSVFTLGDNRVGSSDGRYWRTSFGENMPYVKYEKIVGKYWFRLLSPSSIEVFN